MAMQVIIVDDHELIRTGMADTMRIHFPDVIVLEAANSATALDLIAANDIDLAIIDLYIPGETSFTFVRKLCDSYPALPVVVLSGSENPADIRKCIDIGASGYIPKSYPRERLLAALDQVLRGKIYLPEAINHTIHASFQSNGQVTPGVTLEQVTGSLTPRQREILELLAQGQSNKQIARNCKLSENTIKVHVSAILRTLGLSNRTQAGVLLQQLTNASANTSNKP